MSQSAQSAKFSRRNIATISEDDGGTYVKVPPFRFNSLPQETHCIVRLLAVTFIRNFHPSCRSRN